VTKEIVVLNIRIMKKPVVYLIVVSLMLVTGCTPKDSTRTVKFEGKTFEQKWAIRDLNPNLPSDWSSFEFLTFELNASSTQRFFINLYDSSGIRRLRILPFRLPGCGHQSLW
jgi:hypothetical protein